jgi:hypothetical protein
MHYYLPRSASWIEEMEKRSRRRTRDLVALAASQGLSENESGCARISMMARSTNAPCKGRIQKRKTTLHLLKSGLQRTAGPYKSAKYGSRRLFREHEKKRSLQPLSCNGRAEFLNGVHRTPSLVSAFHSKLFCGHDLALDRCACPHPNTLCRTTGSNQKLENEG